jgi:hypothetical protein
MAFLDGDIYLVHYAVHLELVDYFSKERESIRRGNRENVRESGT